jgi:hypothetical protein
MSRSNPMHHARPVWPFPVRPLDYPSLPPAPRPAPAPVAPPVNAPAAPF